MKPKTLLPHGPRRTRCGAIQVALLLGLSLAWSQAALAQNLVTNGSFELQDPAIATGGFGLPVGSTQITGWEVFDADVDYIFSTWEAADGDYSIDLDGVVGSAGGVRQTIATAVGTTYEVRFSLAGNVALAPPTIKTMRVSAAGQSSDHSFDITGRTTLAMGWQEITWSFIANDVTTTLSFESTADEIGGFTPGWGAAIDDVSVVPIPEPGSALLIGLGLVALSRSRGTRD